MAGKKGCKHYPLELKLEAMRMFCKEGKTAERSQKPWESVIEIGS